MKERILLLSVFILSALCLLAQDNPSLHSFRYLDFNPQLTNSWQFTVEDRSEFSKIKFDDSQWLSGVPGAVIESGREMNENNPVFWVRTQFHISEKLSGTDILMNLEIPGPFEFFINGRKTFSRGNIDEKYDIVGTENPLVTIRDRDLSYGETNILAIRIKRRHDDPVVLPQSNVFRLNGLLYHPSMPSFMQSENFAIISILFSVIFFTLFILRRKDFSSLFFACANLCFAYYFHRMVVPPVYLPYNLSFNFSKVCLLYAVVLLVIFLRYYFGKPFRKAGLIVISICSIGIGALMLVVPKNIASAESLFSLIVLVPSFIGIIYIAVLSYSGIRENRPTASIVFIGAVLAVVMGMHDMIFSIFNLTPRFWLQGLSIISFDFSIFITLILNIMRIFKDLENYTHRVEEAVRDRTKELDEANQYLEKALQSAKDANRAKSDFLANISHEIRTPLNCIVGFAEIVSEQNKDSSIGEYSDLIVQESGKLQHLIDEILDISKIESGKLEAVSEEFNLKEVVESVYRSFYCNVFQKNLDFKYTIDETLPEMFVGDGFRLRQVLMNLTSNAVKFTHEGCIGISVFPVSKKPMQIRFEVTDTGIGIKPELRDTIFDSFVQADTSTARKYGGTGLGTTISKHLVEIMGGSIGFESEEQKGTTFYFILPLKPSTKDKTDTRLSEVFLPRYLKGHVLLVEDYPPNRTLVESMLKDSGISWDAATNGLEALECFQKHKYDLILMDVQMPEMDGCEATKRIRSIELEEKQSPTPIIGFTANAFPEEVQRYIDIGMNDVITKPVKRKSFILKLIRMLSGQTDIPDFEETEKPKNHIFDYQGLLQELRWDSNTSRKLVSEFLDILEIQIDEIKGMLESGKFEEAHRSLHSIRGGAANVYADTLSAKAQLIESFLKQGISNGNAANPAWSGWEELYDDFFSAYNEFKTSARITIE